MRTAQRFLLALFCLGLANVGLASDAKSSAERPLRIVHAQALPVLDPHFHATFIGHSVLGNIFEKLVGFNIDGDLVPVLATGWENPEPMVWRFEIRRRVAFHDGRELTAEDVVASLRRARTHARSRVTNYLSSVDRVAALDERRVEIRTKSPDPILLNKLAFIAIVPGETRAEIVRPVGTGPYRFQDFAGRERLRLAAFEEYWQAPASEGVVEFLFVSDAAERAGLLFKGEVDLIGQLPLEELEAFEKSEDLWVESRVSLAIRFLMMDLNRPPFSDGRVREAVDLALDREALARGVMKNHARPAGQLVGPATPGHTPDLSPPKRDLARARELLAEAGHEGGLELTLHFGSAAGRLSEAVAEQLGEAGIRVRTTAHDWPELLELLRSGEVSMALLGWSNSANDAGVLYDAVIHSRSEGDGYGSANFLSHSNPELDRSIEAGGSIMNPADRLAALRLLAVRVARERVLIPLLRPLDLYGVRRELVWLPRQDGHVYAYEVQRPPAVRTGASAMASSSP